MKRDRKTEREQHQRSCAGGGTVEAVSFLYWEIGKHCMYTADYLARGRRPLAAHTYTSEGKRAVEGSSTMRGPGMPVMPKNVTAGRRRRRRTRKEERKEERKKGRKEERMEASGGGEGQVARNQRY